jgi:hypothetical protein
MHVIMTISLAMFSVLQLQFLGLNIVFCYNMLQGPSAKVCWKFLTSRMMEGFLMNICQPALCWSFLYCQWEPGTQRNVCTVLLFASGLHSLQMLSKLPAIGVQTFMLFRVTGSVFKFFKAFFTLFLSFWLIFHILLQETAAFGSLENAFIKVNESSSETQLTLVHPQVLAMLLGEFDFTSNFVLTETTIVAKIFFLIFILIMALIFMNLLLGIAVADIDELERISKVRLIFVPSILSSQIESSKFVFHTIYLMETILNLWAKMPLMSWTKASSIYHPDREIYLNVVDLDPSPDNRVYVDRGPGVEKWEVTIKHSFVQEVLDIYKVGGHTICALLTKHRQPRVAAARGKVYTKEQQQATAAASGEEVRQLRQAVEELAKLLAAK